MVRELGSFCADPLVPAARTLREILELYGCRGVCEREAPHGKSLLTQIGQATVGVVSEAKGGLTFIGALAVACPI